MIEIYQEGWSFNFVSLLDHNKYCYFAASRLFDLSVKFADLSELNLTELDIVGVEVACE